MVDIVYIENLLLMLLFKVREKRDVRANTAYGTVIGHEVDMNTGDPWDNAMSYLGIRFANTPARWEVSIDIKIIQ